MTTLRQAIADNLILDPETGEWGKSRRMTAEEYFRSNRCVLAIPDQKEKTDHE